MDDEKQAKKSISYSCELCCFDTSSKYNYSRHILTLTHKRMTIGMTKHEYNNANEIYKCKCGNVYKYRQGLFKHKKSCKFVNNNTINIHTSGKIDTTNQELILQLLKENKEFKDLIMDQNQKMMELASKSSVTNNVTNTNSHNKQFNLQFFLNNTCKNAMNMTDFINSLEIKSDELEDMGKLGYVKGISNIFIRALKELDEKERPMHCTDIKRETLYIKDNNIWEKETTDNFKIKKIITYIADKNFRRIPKWKLDNPKSEDIMSKKHIDYMMMLSQVMSGISLDDENGTNKIIRNVANEVYLDKKGVK